MCGVALNTSVTSITLKKALLDLAEAAIRKDDVSVPLLGLQVALATNPSAAEREEAVTSAFAALQQHVYDEAVREYRGPLTSYCNDKTDAMMDLYDRLSAEGYAPVTCKAAPEVTAWMRERLAAATDKDVVKFEDVLLEAMSSFVPPARKLCVNALLFAVQAYVAGEYLSLSTFIADAMDEPPAGQAARTLYAALLSADDWMSYAPDFLLYDNGAFSLADAKSVCAAEDASTLALCLERLAEGLQRVPADLAERIVLDLKREITLRLADFISEKCTEKLSPAGLTCLERIPALLSNVSVTEGDELDAVELTEAISLLSYVATADKDGALLSLSELSLAMDRSPVFHDALAEHAASALLLRVLNELDALSIELPPVETLLVRLYLALNLRGAAALTDDAALSWVCEEA